VPPSWIPDDVSLAERSPRLHRGVRLALVLLAVLLVGVFALALHLDPYRDGHVWYDGTHRQLGLPPCTFKDWTKLPCPTCGMSSSFALLVRGDVIRSLQANAVGTLLAVFLLFLIPWSLLSAVRGRWLFIRSMEWVLVRLIVAFMVLMFVRWAIVLLEIKVSS
jgi:uncharacterized protein DUF2752